MTGMPGPIWSRGPVSESGAAHPRPVTAALDDLLALCARQPIWAPDPLDAFPDATSIRRSAVLVLFGRLDSHPAASDAATVPADLDVLLTRRAMTLSHHPGQVAFPGGGIDPDDAGPEAAALRESAEEAGVDPSGVRVLGTLPELPVTASNNLVTPVLGWWDRPNRVAATDPAETVDVFRVPVAELVDPEHRVTATLHHHGREYRGPAFTVADGTLVWGFTAYVLDRVLHATRWALPWDPDRTVPVS